MDGHTPVEITTLLVSPVHAYEGRPADGPRPDYGPVTRSAVQVRAGAGLLGDRYCGHAAHRRAAVTVLAAESLDAVGREIGGRTGDPATATSATDGPATGGVAAGAHAPLDPVLVRRNIVLRGADVDALAAAGRGGTGAVFSLDSGDGAVRFRAHRPANPCRWMDVVLGPGALRAMRGRGGVRCEPLDDGVLRLGSAELRILESPALARIA